MIFFGNFESLFTFFVFFFYNNFLCDVLAQEKVEKKVRAISSIDREIGQTERELSEHKSKTVEVNELWKIREIKIEELKWMEEKASVILESKLKKNELQSKTMNIIKQNHSNITTCAFKTVRQETAVEIIKCEINNLLYREKELENEMIRWNKTKSENERKLADARVELIAAKVIRNYHRYKMF